MARQSTRRKLAIATWSAPREPNIYGKLTVDASRALAYLDEVRQKTGEKVTITHFVGRVVAQALKEAPTLNGRIVLGRFIPHPTVDVTFAVALDEGTDLATCKVDNTDQKSLVEIAKTVREGAGRLRRGQDADFQKSKGLVRLLPMFLLRPILWLTGWLTGALGVSAKALGLKRFPFGSCFLTSVGMFGIDEGYVPPTPFCRVPLYVLVGAIKAQPAVVDDKLTVQQQVTLCATLDHRFVDGFQVAVLARVIKRMFADPWELERPAGAAAPSPAAAPQPVLEKAP